MNRIDASDHYEVTATGQTPSLLVVVLDTNPRAWQALGPTLSISAALANILVFVNAHLAFGNDNQVAVLAAHSHRAVWLYPKSPNNSSPKSSSKKKRFGGLGGDGDVEMTGVNGSSRNTKAAPLGTSANKYPQFAAIESSILSSLQALIAETDSSDIPYTTLVAGALTTALSYINKTALSFAPAKPSSTDPNASGTGNNNGSGGAAAVAGAQQAPGLHARILVVSVSDSAPSQYIATMNAVFAAAHARIPVDTLSLSPHAAPTFLQQAAFLTGGSYAAASLNPRGLLAYLMLGFLPDAEARQHLLQATQDRVDFRAACFCHRAVVDTGFVCSVCLSIFCEPPPADAGCLTCGTRLALGHYGSKPAVVPRRRKKKKKVNGVGGREETGSATGTPAP
ncbi:transcription factor TFIIH subunit Tfb4 [Apiospora kogelbergensis]|uniref:General transcription and DNA repair factor IIH subunit TFB4 n=1 Tax=Apiospora kogelbergensis TaxID=1337665 RepID=A0AAW0RA99_9PEZI